jgi:hypothetical protein
LVCAAVGALVGRRIGRRIGERRADALAWRIGHAVAAQSAAYVAHPDGTVEPPPTGP